MSTSTNDKVNKGHGEGTCCGATKEETWSIRDHDHCASGNEEEPHAHDDGEEAVLGKVEQSSAGEEARPANTEGAVSVEAEEEFPVHFYDSEIEKMVEAFRSTHKMRWWDSKTEKYVEYFSEVIEDMLNRMDRMDEENGMETGSQEQNWPYYDPQI